MAATLPYLAHTATGEKIEFAFPLHAQTRSGMRVEQLLGAVLGAIDREMRVLGETANGDVLQALAMALAVRTAMLHAPYAVGRDLSAELAASALAAAGECVRQPGVVGHS
jgi:hypothetical protein